MAKNVFIHIGTGKTGSTAIQGFLSGNREILSKRGFNVVTSPHNHHGQIYKAFREGDKALLEEALSEIRKSELPNHVLSFEGFYHLSGDLLNEFIKEFKGLTVRPIIYLRRRSDKIRSGLSQRMKLKKLENEHYLKIIERLFTRDFSRDAEDNLNYREIVERWEAAILPARKAPRVIVRVFERSFFKDGDLISDFLCAIGALGAEEKLVDTEYKLLGGDVNPSIGPAAQYLMALMVILELTDQQRKMVRNVLLEAGDVLDGKSSLIPDDVVKPWDERFVKEDKLLARKYLGRDELFTEPAKFKYSEPTSDQFVQLISRLYLDKKNAEPVSAFRKKRRQNGMSADNNPDQNAQESFTNPVDMHFKQGMLAAESDNLEEAFSQFQRVISLRPKHFKVRLELAKLLLANGKQEEGLVHLQKARTLRPEKKMAIDRLCKKFNVNA